MDDERANLKREVQELKAEVRHLRRLVETGLVVFGVAIIYFTPQLALAAAGLGVMILFAFLVSPVRKLIFQYLFHDRIFVNHKS
jgi:multisubunit Na+/H+ antiporter MnhG subunit